MPKYIFLLGQCSDLAKQELLNILGPAKIDYFGPDFCLAETAQPSKQLIDSLGGTIKIAPFLTKLNNLEELTAPQWLGYLSNKNDSAKINFGFSLYHDSAKNYQKILRLALGLKKTLKNTRPARLVTSQEPVLSSVIVAKNKLLGRELIIIKDQEEYFLGLTEVVQDFSQYGYLDMARPARDSRSGMLPPKVAQMMLNLAGPDRQKTLLDPFCGSGTIIQEALRLGYQEIIGSDSSQKAIDDTTKNLEWLKENFKLGAGVDLQKIPVQSLGQHLAPASVDLIVTEPYLGDARFINKQNKIADLQPLVNELQELYLEAFRQFKTILRPGGQIIFIWPIFTLAEKKIFSLETKILPQINFKLKKTDLSSANLSPLGNIIYSRPQQKVQREITIWE
jgi:SAM-dependent methyltransferase